MNKKQGIFAGLMYFVVWFVVALFVTWGNNTISLREAYIGLVTISAIILALYVCIFGGIMLFEKLGD